MVAVLSRALPLAALLLGGARGSVSDTVVSGRRAQEEASAPPAEAVTLPADLPSGSEVPPDGGESLVLCRGPYLCSGEASWAGGVRACDEGLFCQQSAVLLMQGSGPEAAKAEESQESQESAVAAAAAKPSEPAGQGADDGAKMEELEKQLQGSEAKDLAESVETLFYCAGARVCRRWGWYLGRWTCTGGFYCRAGPYYHPYHPYRPYHPYGPYYRRGGH